MSRSNLKKSKENPIVNRIEFRNDGVINWYNKPSKSKIEFDFESGEPLKCAYVDHRFFLKGQDKKGKGVNKDRWIVSSSYHKRTDSIKVYYRGAKDHLLEGSLENPTDKENQTPLAAYKEQKNLTVCLKLIVVLENGELSEITFSASGRTVFMDAKKDRNKFVDNPDFVIVGINQPEMIGDRENENDTYVPVFEMFQELEKGHIETALKLEKEYNDFFVKNEDTPEEKKEEEKPVDEKEVIESGTKEEFILD